MALEWEEARDRAKTATEEGSRSNSTESRREIIKRTSEPLAWEAVTIDQTGRLTREGEPGSGFCQLVWDYVFDCAFCGGKGERPAGTLCSVCRGSGRVSIEPPVVVCAFCRGRGKVSRSSNVTCTSCKGYGVISVREPIEVCPLCRGKGKQKGANLACIRCKGSGVIEKKE